MNRTNSIKSVAWTMAALTAAVLAGCGGGGDGGSAPPPPAPPAAAVGDISGDWTVTEDTMIASDPACEPAGGNPLANYNLTIAQTGDAVVVTDATNASPPADFQGSLHGSKLTWSGSFTELGGTTTYNTVDLTVDPADCGTFTGTTTWTYVQDAPATFSCTGTTTLHAVDTGTASCAASSS